jgi:hypothetical protein
VGSALYEIRIRGRLGDSVSRSFTGFAASVEAGETVLRGSIGDQAELHSVLEQVEAFGLELVEVRRLDTPRRSLDA